MTSLAVHIKSPAVRAKSHAITMAARSTNALTHSDIFTSTILPYTLAYQSQRIRFAPLVTLSSSGGKNRCGWIVMLLASDVTVVFFCCLEQLKSPVHCQCFGALAQGIHGFLW
jgi:hypothetical protein